MPTSTAATTMRASSPAASPATLTGMRSALFGRSSCGRLMSSASVRALRLTANHCTPMARPGMRSALRIERTAQRCDHIGAAAPVVADRNAQPRGAGGTSWVTVRDQPVADHVERDLAGGARGDRDGHGLARRVFRLVERDLEQVRRVGARLGVPAGVEADRGHGPVALAGRDFQPIAAPLHRHRDARRLVGGDVDLAVGDAPRRLHRLEVPACRRGGTTDTGSRP